MTLPEGTALGFIEHLNTPPLSEPRTNMSGSCLVNEMQVTQKEMKINYFENTRELFSNLNKW